MKTYSASLLSDVVSSYDKTKTTIAGRVFQKTINSTPVLGPPLTKFIDVFTDTLGTFIPGQMFLSPNGRLFVLQSNLLSGATNQIAMYTFNSNTGATVYVGKIQFNIASPVTVTVRGFKVDDGNTSNIKIFISFVDTTVTTGGTMMLWKVALADFVPAGFPTLYSAIANDVKAVYFLLNPAEVGGANLMTALTGLSLPCSSSNAAINTKIFCHNGLSATHQHYIFDYATAPTLAGLGTSTVTTANTTGANTTFTMAGNTLAVNDTVVITSNAPTNYTVSTNAAAQQVYYVVATNFVAGTTFSLATALGGTIVNGSTAIGTTTFIRALGQSTNLFFAKTANLPVTAGTLLSTNSENYCVPSHTANSGQDCVFYSSSTTMYLGKYMDLFSQQSGTTNATINMTGLTSTAGLTIGQTVFGTGIPNGTTIATIVSGTAITLSQAATTSTTQTITFGAILWPSLVNANVLGIGTDYLIPLPVNAVFSTECDAVIFNTAGIFSLIKKFQNSVILGSVGTASQIYLEAQNHVTDQFSLTTVTGLETRQGWLLASCTTVPQRGIVAMDLRSDTLFNYSYIVSPVMRTLDSTLKAVSTLEELFDSTASVKLQYRTGSSASDTIFNSATTNWTDITTAEDLSTFPNNGYVQFRILFAMATTPTSSNPSITIPTQVADLLLTTQPNTEISDNWDYSYDASATTIPTRVGFKLRLPYSSGTVPTIHYRAYDESGALLVHHDTVTNISNFQYSTDQGVSWTPLGTIPNTVGTLIRYTYTTPPGVNIRVSVRES